MLQKSVPLEFIHAKRTIKNESFQNLLQKQRKEAYKESMHVCLQSMKYDVRKEPHEILSLKKN